MPDEEMKESEEGEGTPPVDETREERFIRLANARVNKVIHQIRNIGNLASASYESTPTQRKAVIDTLRKTLDEVEYIFAGEASGPKEVLFKLSTPIKSEGAE